MAVINGLDSTETIRDAGKVDLPIADLTANAFETDQEACFVAGINNFISKLVKAKEIKKAIVKWVLATRIPKAHAKPS